MQHRDRIVLQKIVKEIDIGKQLLFIMNGAKKTSLISVAWDIVPAIDSNVAWNNKVDLCPDICYMDSIPIS